MSSKPLIPKDEPTEPLPSYKDYLHIKETNIGILLAQHPLKTPQPSQSNPPTSQNKFEDKPRVFLITYAEPGIGKENVGRQFMLTAETHKRELEKGDFPDEGHSPNFRPGKDIIKIINIHNAQDLVKELNIGNVAYLAYFGHAGILKVPGLDNDETSVQSRHGAGAMYIGYDGSPGTFLTQNKKPDTNSKYADVSVLSKDKFTEDAQIRLFGCRAGLGHPPIAQQIAEHLNVTVYAYISRGGSVFTKDRELGHGKRKLNKDEHLQTIGNISNDTDLWLVTFGVPVDINNKPTDTDTAWKKFEASAPKNENKQKTDTKNPDAVTPDAQTPSDETQNDSVIQLGR